MMAGLAAAHWRDWLGVGVLRDGFYFAVVAALNGSGFLLFCVPPSVLDLDKLGPCRNLAVDVVG
jgi:hypothetical protein